MNSRLLILPPAVRSRRIGFFFVNAILLCQLLTGAGESRAATQSEAARTLEQGAAIERALSGGQTHTYQIRLALGQYIRVTVDQKWVDVVVTVLNPQGQTTLKIDSASDGEGSEAVAFICETPGDYTLRVNASNEHAIAGQYSIRVDEIRNATEWDKSFARALRLSAEAGALTELGAGDAAEKAAKLFEESLTLWQSLEEREREADTLRALSALYVQKLGDNIKAKDFGEKEILLRRALGRNFQEGAARESLAFIYMEVLGDNNKALEHYQQSAESYRASSHPAKEGYALRVMTQFYSSKANLQSAQESIQKAIAIFHESGDRSEEARAYFEASAVNYNFAQWQPGIEAANNGLALARAVGNKHIEAICLGVLGSHTVKMQKPQEAIVYVKQALEILRKRGNLTEQVTQLGNLCNDYTFAGEYQQALDACTEAVSLSKKMNDAVGQVYNFYNLGKVCQLLKDWAKARESYEAALTAMYTSGYRNSIEALILNYLSTVAQELNDLPGARVYSERAIEVAERTIALFAREDQRARYLSGSQPFYENYLNVLMRMHQEQPGKGYDAEALQVSERSRARGLIQRLAEAKADIRQGIDQSLLAKELELKKKLNAKANEQSANATLERDPAKAAALKKEVAELSERLDGVGEQIRFSSPRYAALTRPKALTAVEMQQRMLAEDTVLVEFALGEKQSWLWAITPSQIASFKLPARSSIETSARKVYESLTARHAKKGESEAQYQTRVDEANSTLQTESATLSQMLFGQIATKLQQEWKGKRLAIVASGVLEYIPFAALPIPQQAETRSPTDTSTTGAQIRHPQFPQLLITQHEIVNLPSATTLAAIRSETVERKRSETSVAIIADPVFEATDPRVLSSLKKAASNKVVSGLRSGGESETTPELQVSSSANADLLRSMKSVSLTNERGGFSRLPFSREEANAIASLSPKSSLMEATDFEANRANAISGELARYRIVHFATHGLLNSEQPELSGLVLSLVDENGKPQDGFLRMHEIYNLKLPADLIVLSACQTALGKQIKGEGLVGLTRGFMYAGAQRVVASLWQVDDLATAELMKRFYRGMVKEGLRPAQALRLAQLDMLRQKRWSSAYFWAAFTIQGEWR